MSWYQSYTKQKGIKDLVALLVIISGLYGCVQCLEKDDPKIVEVCFTPGGNCAKIVREAILNAEDTILVQAYVFTARPIASALIDAHEKGVVVKILVDRSQLTQPSNQLKRLINKGVPIWVDDIAGIAHNKVMVIDSRYVITGSYNWSNAAENHNAENLVVIDHKVTNRAYRSNWEERVKNAYRIGLSDLTHQDGK